MSDDGLVTIISNHPVRETIDRAEALVKQNGGTVFARIDHAAGAAAVGMTLMPMELLVFGNPAGGTPLMQAAPRFGIDLPLKLLAWQDTDGKTRLTWNALAWLGARHGGGVAPESMTARLQALEANVRALAEKSAA